MPDPETQRESGRVVLGRIVGAHGLRGEVRVRVFGDAPDNLASAPVVWLAATQDDPDARQHAVRTAGSGRPGELRLGLEDIADRDAAEQLRGRLVLGDPANLAPLDEGEFYWHELVGCEVCARTGESLGVVVEIWETGAHDVLVVQSDEGRRHLLSTARELMPEVDLPARRIVVELLPGMLDPEEGL